jgi:hypothetical protein
MKREFLTYHGILKNKTVPIPTTVYNGGTTDAIKKMHNTYTIHRKLRKT